ncbi:MAG TPA: hypothetical protein PLW65_09130, partial [Pseudomonadota bacterium]|nr:hypothetical protein [Pseudomonadota bacterium]
FARNPYGSGNHPPGETRSEVLQTAWRSVRDGTPVQGNEPNQVVAGLLAAHFAAWQPHVQADEALMTHGPLPPRLVAGSLRRDADGGAQPDALRNKCEALFKEFPLPDWSLTEARLLTLRSAMRHLVETRLSSGPEPWKLPPVELLVRHDVISFVGATHGQLLESLKKARQQRGERPWTRIELYALADAPLRRLTLGQKSGQALFEERDASLRELRSYLSQHKIAHQQYLYDDSYLVVSYWDAEDNEARPRGGAPAHIHVSSHLWGLDLRRAPAHDYEAPAGEPLPPQMRQYVDALRQLRKLSSEI